MEEKTLNGAIVFMILGGIGFIITHLIVSWNVLVYGSFILALVTFFLPVVSSLFWLIIDYAASGYVTWIHLLFAASLACFAMYYILVILASKTESRQGRKKPAQPVQPAPSTPPAPPVLPADPGQRRYSPGVEAYMQLQRQAGQIKEQTPPVSEDAKENAEKILEIIKQMKEAGQI